MLQGPSQHITPLTNLQCLRVFDNIDRVAKAFFNFRSVRETQGISLAVTSIAVSEIHLVLTFAIGFSSTNT